jgi:hypothetical protein
MREMHDYGLDSALALAGRRYLRDNMSVMHSCFMHPLCYYLRQM